MPLDRRLLLAVVAVAGCAVVAALAARTQAASQGRITVYAAASLTDVLPKIDGSPRYSFGGSNMLAARSTTLLCPSVMGSKLPA